MMKHMSVYSIAPTRSSRAARAGLMGAAELVQKRASEGLEGCPNQRCYETSSLLAAPVSSTVRSDHLNYQERHEVCPESLLLSSAEGS